MYFPFWPMLTIVEPFGELPEIKQEHSAKYGSSRFGPMDLEVRSMNRFRGRSDAAFRLCRHSFAKLLPTG
jgi:hypothetical protein